MRHDFCIFCNSLVAGAFATIAPWILELSGRESSDTFYFQCVECTYSWFSRYDDEILNALYVQYRSINYYKVRHSWEPWYGKKENSAFSQLNHSPDSHKNQTSERRKRINQLFSEAQIDLSLLSSCLDYGGDDGQFIPEQISGRKYVLDPSLTTSKNSASISFVSDVQQIPDRSLDLVMLCMVLEHLNEPRLVLKSACAKISSGKFLYIEVPQDFFEISKFHASDIYRRYLKFVESKKLLFILIDFLTGIHRLCFRRIPIWGILKQSEHINYFRVKTLHSLLGDEDFKIVAMTDDSFSGQGRIRMGSIRLIAQREPILGISGKE